MFEGIDPVALGAVRALARELRYRSLPSLVGRRVRIDSVAAIDRAMRAALPEVPASSALANEGIQMGLTLAKYGILDLQFVGGAIDAPAVGFRELRELGLLQLDEAERGEEALWSSDAKALTRWLDECRSGPPLTKVFLAGPRPRDVAPSWFQRLGWRGRRVDEYLPQELEIIDACETNGSFVWLVKHFYL